MTRMHNVPLPTPELDKTLAATKKGSQAIGEFLEWLLHERGFVLAKHERVKDRHESDRLIHHPIAINALLAEYYGVDQDKAEQERMLVLQNFRVRQGMTPDGGPIEGGGG